MNKVGHESQSKVHCSVLFCFSLIFVIVFASHVGHKLLFPPLHVSLYLSPHQESLLSFSLTLGGWDMIDCSGS